MVKNSGKKPTAAELEILSVLWRDGSATVREVHDTLAHRKPIGYTTTLKLMQNMHEKGLVARDESRRSHVYRPALSQASAQRTMLRTVLDRLFGGIGRRAGGAGDPLGRNQSRRTDGNPPSWTAWKEKRNERMARVDDRQPGPAFGLDVVAFRLGGRGGGRRPGGGPGGIAPAVGPRPLSGRLRGDGDCGGGPGNHVPSASADPDSSAE